MFGIVAFLVIVAAALLTLLVVIQNSKGGGLNSAFGASNITSMIGTRRASQDVEKFTWYMAAALGALCLISAAFIGKTDSKPNTQFSTLIEDRYTMPEAPPAEEAAAPDAPADGQ